MLTRSLIALVLCLGMLGASSNRVFASEASQKALKLYSSGQFLKAAHAYTNLLKTQETSQNYFYLANCYYRLGQSGRARVVYQLIEKKFPGSPEANNSKKMLARLAGGSSRTTNINASTLTKVPSIRRASSSQSRSRSQGQPSDLDKLPNENRIYFTQGRGGHMLVDIYLNNRPMKAWFDTGASAHFGANHLRAAGVQLPRGKMNGLSTGWAGKNIGVWRKFMKLRMGNMERTVPVTIEQNMTLTPLVGQQFLRGYDYEIHNNGPRKYVTMKKRSTGSTSRHSNRQISALYDVPCRTEHNRDFVKMKVNGKELEVLLDTGAESTILSYAACKRLGIRIPANAPVRNSQGVGGGVQFRQVPMDIRIGPIYKRNFVVSVGGGGDTSAIGQNLLRGHRYTIDRKMKLLRFFH